LHFGFTNPCMMWLPLTNIFFWFSCFQDDFNLTGLSTMVPYYDYALDMVLDVEMPMEDSLTEEQQEIVESAAEMLYGLIHARYIITNRGMHAMYEKYRMAHFGRCPHVFCQGQPVLPVGLSDLPRNYTVNVFCPRCHGLFFPKSTRQANIDGAYFGTTFPHLYLMTHPVRPAFSCHLMEQKVSLVLTSAATRFYFIMLKCRTWFQQNQRRLISHACTAFELMSKACITKTGKTMRTTLHKGQKHPTRDKVGDPKGVGESRR